MSFLTRQPLANAAIIFSGFAWSFCEGAAGVTWISKWYWAMPNSNP
jgi:hypothetical protein